MWAAYCQAIPWLLGLRVHLLSLTCIVSLPYKSDKRCMMQKAVLLCDCLLSSHHISLYIILLAQVAKFCSYFINGILNGFVVVPCPPIRVWRHNSMLSELLHCCFRRTARHNHRRLWSPEHVHSKGLTFHCYHHNSHVNKMDSLFSFT